MTMPKVAKLLSLAAMSLAIATPAFAEGDAAAGKRVFNKCKSCHVLAEGKHRTGPSLYQIIGRTAGSTDYKRYSDEMKASGIVWNEETLTPYLKKPSDYVPGTNMKFPGLRKDADIANVIAYLKAESGS